MMSQNRLIAPTIDEQARSRPEATFFSVPKNNNDITEGFVDVSCQQFANAINHAASWLQKSLAAPRNTNSRRAIAYQGPNDLRYPILAVAASKVGLEILFPFSLAPPSIKLHLLRSTGCEYLLHTSQAHDQVRGLLVDDPKIESLVVPELTSWLNNTRADPFPFTKSWEEGKDEPWLIFHTSGTTGLPKTITYTNRMLTSFNVAQHLGEPMYQTQIGVHIKRRCYSSVPLSHFSGICAALQGPVFLQLVNILGPASRIPSPDLVRDILHHSRAEGFVGFPSLLREMVQQPGTLGTLKALDYIQWIGAALDSETGNTLSQSVKLCPAMGTTECGPYFLKTADDPKDWAFYAFQAGQGIEFMEKAEDLYELVFKKSAAAQWQQVFMVFPEIDVYETKDLFRRHPNKEGLWAYMGRTDDMVVLSTSANVNAALVEEKVVVDPNISLALVGGNGRKYPFIIVELTEAGSRIRKEQGIPGALDSIWQTVERANNGLSDYTRLRRDYTIITTGEKRLARNPKGSVLRGPSLEAFGREIEALYAS